MPSSAPLHTCWWYAPGIVWTFSPTIAVVDDIRWGRTFESFGSDPEMVTRLGAAHVKGLQGADGRSVSLLFLLLALLILATTSYSILLLPLA